MKVRLVSPVWADTNKLPVGLTLNGEYQVTETFHANRFDKYFRILDDNNNEQAWNSELFEIVKS